MKKASKIKQTNSKRLFLIGASSDEIRELQKHSNHNILYWLGLDRDRIELPGAIFHDHYAAWDGIPAKGVDINEFSPPSRDLIEKFHKTESLTLTMMNKRYDSVCVDERRHIYYNMLQYWHGIIKKLKPEVIVFPIVPHTVYNYIIYELARHLSIKTIMFDDCWISDKMLMYNDWRKGSLALQKALAENQGKNFSVNDLSPDVRDYYKVQTDSKSNATPVDMQFFQKKFSRKSAVIRKFKIALDSIKDGTIFKKTAQYIVRQAVKRFKPNLKKEYQQLQIKPDFTKLFVYTPLAFQPELATSPSGDIFVDQILMVETIAASLPKGWLVYVKEHPTQWWFRSKTRYSSNRYPGYYERLAKIKNVFLVPINTDTFTLINKSQAVAVATGRAGWEAILRSKPAIIFGYPWFRDCPSILRAKDTETCKLALQKIANGYCVSQQDIINYLKSFEQVAIHGYIESFLAKHSELSEKENISNRIKVVLKEIEKI